MCPQLQVELFAAAPNTPAARVTANVTTPNTAHAPAGPQEGAAAADDPTPAGTQGVQGPSCKPTFGKAADSFLMPFIVKWISDQGDRPARVRTISAILEAVATDSSVNSTGWNPKNLEFRLKKLAAKVRHTS